MLAASLATLLLPHDSALVAPAHPLTLHLQQQVHAGLFAIQPHSEQNVVDESKCGSPTVIDESECGR